MQFKLGRFKYGSKVLRFLTRLVVHDLPQKKIFIGGGMLPEVYEILSNIAIGMGENPQIISDQSNLSIATIKPKKLKSLLINVGQLRLLFQLPKYYFIVLRSITKPRSKRNFFENQLYSSYYGVALIKNTEGRIYLSLKAKVIGFIGVITGTTKFAILKNAKVSTFVMAHMVYGARAIIAWAREYDLKVFASANHTIFRLRPDEDDYVHIRPRHAYGELANIIDKSDLDRFWQKKQTGESGSAEWDFAAQGARTITEGVNIVFLHVFRDSPFICIGPSGIFSDYMEWVDKTLEIVKESAEPWIFKFHPSSVRWGESPERWAKIWREKHALDKHPHIQFIFSDLSNHQAIEKSRRIVTYSGRVQLEALAVGKQSICILNSVTSRFSNDGCMCPESIEEYRNLLISPSGESGVVNEYTRIMAKSIMYAQSNLYSYADIAGAKRIFRGENNDLAATMRIFETVKKSVQKESMYFRRLGNLLETGALDISYTPKYLKQLRLM